MLNIRFQLFTLLFLLVFSACKKEKSETYGIFQLYLTDTPGEFNNVYLDIQSVEIMQEGLSWKTAESFNPGVYDILSLKNGIDTLIVNQSFRTDLKITQIRLKLGANNSIVKNGTSYVLVIPSGLQSGIKINVNVNTVENGTVQHWVDFNIGKSIKELPNNTYKLNPVFRTYDAAHFSVVKGYLFPQNALGYVTAISNNDTVFAIPNSNGFYQFSGLQGTYFISYVPTIGQYVTQDYGNISITGNNVIQLPDFSF